jgi:D-3-phosphoglycerate dehydrogenase
MHLLFADSVADQTIAELESRGHRCSVEPALTTAELPGRIVGVDGLVVRSTKVDRAVFEAADKLALVIRAGAGTNTIDIEAAARNGVLVCNLPGRNAVAVAELTMGLILALDRRIADNVADARQGRWAKATYSKANGLLGAPSASSAWARSASPWPSGRPGSRCGSAAWTALAAAEPPATGWPSSTWCATARSRSCSPPPTW